MKTHLHDALQADLLGDAVEFFLEHQSFQQCDADVPKLKELLRQLRRAHKFSILTDEAN